MNLTSGTSKLKALLLLVIRNAMTNSAWLIINSPAAKFNVRYFSDGKKYGM
jgi:hypothetical protein